MNPFHNGTSNHGNGEEPPDRHGLSLAAALWSYDDKLLAGETPSADDLLSLCPGKKPEVEGILSLLHWGKAVLSPADSSSEKSRSTLQPCEEGEILGDYRIVREIGRGGMGVIYEAEQLSLKRPVALKVLPRVLRLESAGLQRFQREACIAGTLHHTNIVPVYDFGLDQGVAYYSMELISGRSLDALLESLRAESATPASPRHLEILGGPMEDDRKFVSAAPGASRAVAIAFARKAAWLLSGVAEGLHMAHQGGVVHRDVKPANLLLSATGHLVLTDFGVARMRDAGAITTVGRSMGTPHYMSPEQAASSQATVDHRTDIYSLGVTLYELLTLKLPFTGRNTSEIFARIARSEPPAIRRFNSWIPNDLEAIVLRAMEKSAASRYETALELSNDLRRFVLGEQVVARKPSVLRRLGRRAVRHWKIMAMILAFSAVAGLGGWAYVSSRESDLRYREARSEQLIQTAESLLAGGRTQVEPALLVTSGKVGSSPLQAAKCLSEALDLRPGNGHAHFLRGNARFEAGLLEDAIDDFTSAIERTADVGPAYYRRGMAFDCLGRLEEARRDIATAVEIAPGDGLLSLYRGVAAQAEGNIPEAIELLHTAFEKSPALRPEAFYRLALCHHGREDYDQAIACLRVSIGLRPGWISPVHLLARIGAERQDPVLVDEVIRTLRQFSPLNENASFILSDCLQFRGDLIGSLQALEGLSRPRMLQQTQAEILGAILKGDLAGQEVAVMKQLGREPEEFLSLKWLGDLRLSQKRYEDALGAYSKADEHAGRRWTALLDVGEVLLLLDRPGEAVEVLERAVTRRRQAIANFAILTIERSFPVEDWPMEIEPETGRTSPARPDRVNPRILLGEAYRRLGRLADSREALEMAISEHPKSSAARFQMGCTLGGIGSTERAIQELEEALRLGNDDSWVKVTLARLHGSTGRVEQAQRTLEDALRLDPEDEVFALSLGRLWLFVREPDRALKACDSGLASGRRPWLFHLIRGRAFKLLGRMAEAEVAFRRVTELAPNWTAGHWELGLLHMEGTDARSAELCFRAALDGADRAPEANDDPFPTTDTVPRREIRHRLAIAILAQGRSEDAASAFAEMLETPVESPGVAVEMVEHLAQQGEPAKALEKADESIARWSDSTSLLLFRAKLHMKAGRTQLALRDHEQVVDIGPRRPASYSWLASTHLLLGHPERAEETFRRGLKAIPGDPLLSHRLADFLLERSRHKEAIAILRDLVSSPGARPTPEIANDLIWALLMAPDPSDRDASLAFKLARPLVTEAPDSAMILNTCGLAFLRTGRDEESLGILQRADWLYRARDPRSKARGTNLVLLSLACSALKRWEEARSALESGTALDPSGEFHDEAERALGARKE